MNVNYDVIEEVHCQALAYERSSIERCKTVFHDKTFFDLGFCDGLWSYAAFQAGAKKVIAYDKDHPARFKRFLGYGDRFEGIIGIVGDGVYPELCQNSFVKMDIEGWEIPALKGMKNSIRRWKPDLMIEVHGDGKPKNEIVQMLREYLGREPSGENYILNHLYHLYYLPRDI